MLSFVSHIRFRYFHRKLAFFSESSRVPPQLRQSGHRRLGKGIEDDFGRTPKCKYSVTEYSAIDVEIFRSFYRPMF